MKKVMIDSGHFKGNSNKGKMGYYEYEGVWKISTYLKEILELKNIQVDFTHEYEKDLDLYARGQLAEGYDLFISEHSNAYNQKSQGVEVFYDYSKPKDKAYAEELSLVVSKIMNNLNRGSKIRTFVGVDNRIYNYYGVIRGASATNCLHIFIIENGFHDNLIDEAFLKVDENLKKIAQAQANVICELLGVVNNMEFDKAKQIVREKAKLEDVSMKYLTDYTYSESLITSLAKAINGEVIEDVTTKPVVVVEEPRVAYTKTTNGTYMLIGNPEDLKIKEVNKSNTKITELNCINSSFFWKLADGTKYSTSILYADGVTYQSYANHLPYPQSAFIINKDASVEMKRIKTLGELNLSKVRLVIAGVGLLNKLDSTFKYNPASEGFSGAYADVLRKTNKTMIVYNKKEDKIYLVCRANIYHQSALYYDLVELAGDIGDVAVGLDGGGSSMMRANGIDVFKGDSRVIHAVLHF